MSSYKVDIVLPKLAASLGEGPHWDDATQTLLFVDTPNNDLFRYDPATGNTDVLHLDGPPSFVIPREKGGLVVSLKRTVSAVEWATKTVIPLAEVDKGSDNVTNDGKCDANGRLWTGTFDMDRTADRDTGRLYRLDVDGTLTKMEDNVLVSNGMAFSKDNKYFYYIDSAPRKVYVYDFDLAKGTISNKRVAVDIFTIPEFKDTQATPDGMNIDTDGNLWVALVYFGIAKFDPTGKLLETITFPGCTEVSSCCWGGKNYDELYVTSMRMNIPQAKLDTTEVNGGSLFRVTGLGAKGFAANVYRG